jgi:hypothetical protein
MSDGDDLQVPPAAPAKPTLKQRLSALFSEYGRIAIVTYFTISILTIIGFSIAFGIGVAPSSATGVIGVIAAGWVAAKATLPIRVLITLGLTPPIGYVVSRRRRIASAAEEPQDAGETRGPDDL